MQDITERTEDGMKTTMVDTLAAAGWIEHERNAWLHPAHPGHVITASRRGSGWTHSERYSTGYKIHARSINAAALAGHLLRSKSLNAARKEG